MAQTSKRRKSIVLTGCTGFVGRELVPELEALDIELLLVGRNTETIRELFPGRRACDYASFENCGGHYDALVHLAVVNNDSDASESEFYSVNVDFTVQLAELAKRLGIREFIHLSSFHALDASRDDPYSRSKRAASVALQAVKGIDITDLYLPAVYGRRWSGKLQRLNKLPPWLSRNIFRALAAWRPAVHVRTVALFLANDPEKRGCDRVHIADDQDCNLFYRFPKRVLDLAFAAAVVVLLGWLLVVVWGIVRLESRGPGIFAQPRVGRAGKIFTCYKFRTMLVGTRQVGTHEVTAASVTRVGKFLRATKLDELPQVLNILRNELSLVGPRPCLPVQEQLIAARHALGVLSIKPGITGFAQINGIDMSDPARLARIDAEYKATRSLSLDLRIGLATFIGRGRGDKIRTT